ncbi:MAG TPA: hypothetical protein VKR06_09000, partial [Ktedonosporobacter sp.]|nr:hypothetical protein [Ktedonosporobacter sp.]
MGSIEFRALFADGSAGNEGGGDLGGSPPPSFYSRFRVFLPAHLGGDHDHQGADEQPEEGFGGILENQMYNAVVVSQSQIRG